jgi:hypothetical protein
MCDVMKVIGCGHRRSEVRARSKVAYSRRRQSCWFEKFGLRWMFWRGFTMVNPLYVDVGHGVTDR